MERHSGRRARGARCVRGCGREGDGLPSYQTDFAPGDYAAIAEAAGRAAFTEALEHLGPARVDLVIDPNALSMPPHITGTQIKGFALAASE